MKELFRINEKSVKEHRRDDGEPIATYSELLHRIGEIQNVILKGNTVTRTPSLVLTTVSLNTCCNYL